MFVVIGLVTNTTVMAQAKGTKPATAKKEEDKGKIVRDEEVKDDANPVTFDTSSVPNDELTGAIRELLAETRALNMFSVTAKRMIDMQRKNPNTNLPDVFYDRFLADMENGESFRWMANELIKAYRKRFTVEDIQALTVFFKSPAGKKLTTSTPEITQETMAAGEKIGAYVAVKIYTQLQREGKIN